jgi:hypothetical protein
MRTMNQRLRSMRLESLVLAFALLMAAADAVQAESPSRADDAGVAAGAPEGQPPQRKPRYVPGEVIVKLRTGRTEGMQIAAASADQGILRRLETRHGLSSQGPVFRRVHEALQPGPLSSGGRIGMTSSAERSGQVSEFDLLRFYVLKTERDVRRVCAQLNEDPDVEYAQPNYIYHICRTFRTSTLIN